jgi:hypothetical protein
MVGVPRKMARTRSQTLREIMLTLDLSLRTVLAQQLLGRGLLPQPMAALSACFPKILKYIRNHKQDNILLRYEHQ